MISLYDKYLNPHEIINKKNSSYFVKGLYAYYHYLHDNIKDKNWGCAYRSL